MSGTVGTAEQAATFEHEIGPQGELVVRVPDGEISLRGTDGSRVSVHDLGPSARLAILRSDGRLEIGLADEGRPEDGLARWLRWGRARAHLEIEVPHAVRVQVEVTTATIRVVGLDGEQGYRTVSGEIDLLDSGGAVAVEGVSGDVAIAARGPLALHARTVSGDLRASSPLLRELQLSTMSGDLRLEGQLAAGDHRIETVSGDAVLLGPTNLAVAASTISGGVATDLAHHVDGGRGRQRLVIGDGAAHLLFRSMSGDLDV
ncbi:MAG TPA: DUF4097 family beta strand repeat-containing protein, partial [Candidatus Dormibacteraeota bacterium]|nr:DUF4097 family beta strand repeat-containing protein [Candidatus Dormibacteraeota bacterium]